MVLVLMFLLLSVMPASAAKKRVWKSVPVSAGRTASGGGFSVGAKLTGWKQYLNVSFRGVSSIGEVSYELTYNSNDTEQGVYGTVKQSDGNTTRSIFLGTCSHGACVAHKNVSNIHLTITYKTLSGQTVVKKYKVKY